MYKFLFKRVIDFCLSLLGLLFLSPVLLFLIIVGAIIMKGNPFFVQPRPGKNGKVFKLIKFRTMTQDKDKDGNLLPDEKRLTKYGEFLRMTSLDELLELLNILKGDMAIVGPRPQLIKDYVFMSEKERQRHSVLPGLTGLAQVKGRNNISWEEKLKYDLEYVEKISFLLDVRIFFLTISKVLARKDVNREGTASDIDFGDWLLKEGLVTQEEYDKKIKEAKEVVLNG